MTRNTTVAIKKVSGYKYLVLVLVGMVILFAYYVLSGRSF